MAESFEIAKGHVRVDVTLDDTQAKAVGEQASEKIAREIEANAPRFDEAGKTAGEHMGDSAAKSADEKLKAAKEKFQETLKDGTDGKPAGEEFGKDFSAAAFGSIFSPTAAQQQERAEAAQRAKAAFAAAFGNVPEMLAEDAATQAKWDAFAKSTAGRTGDVFSKLFASKGFQSADEWARSFGTELPFGLGLFFKGSQALAKLFIDVGSEAGSAIEGGIAGGVRGGFSGGAESLATDATDAFSPQGMIGLAIAGALAATIVGAVSSALGGAVATGVGLGGVAVGIVGAMQNPTVKSAMQALGADAKAVLGEATSSFVGPTKQAISDFDSFLLRDEPKLAKLFGPLSQDVVGIERGLEGAVDSFLTRVGSVNFTPFIDMADRVLPKMGDTAGKFIQEISQPQAAQALETLIDLILHATEALGGFIEVEEKLGDMQKLKMAIEGPADLLGRLTGKSHDTQTAFKDLRDQSMDTWQAIQWGDSSLAGLTAQMNQTNVSADTLAAQMVGRVFNALMSVDNASLGWYQSLNQVTDALKQNGTTLDITTEKGEANRSAILAAVTANMQQYQSSVAVGVSATDAAAAYDQNTQALERQLEKAGLTKDKVDQLIGKYEAVPDQVNTDIKAGGLTGALNLLNQYLAKLLGLDNKHTTNYIDTYLRTFENSNVRAGGSAQRYGGVVHAAQGLVAGGASGIMPEQDPPAVWFAERGTGDELFMPLRGITQGRAHALLQTGATAYGMDVVPRAATGAVTGGGTTTPVPGYSHVFNLQLGADVVASFVLQTIDANPIVVSRAVQSGDRIRTGLGGGR